LATHSNIASEFNALEDSTWLITSFALAGAATQTIYGKLSDIYGRRTLVLIAYGIFVVGCAIVYVPFSSSMASRLTAESGVLAKHTGKSFWVALSREQAPPEWPASFPSSSQIFCPFAKLPNGAPT
jgi:MFS family permease